MKVLHQLAHLLRLNGCLPDSEWRGETLWMRLRCGSCGEICGEWPTGVTVKPRHFAPMATINAPPLAPICYICGVAQDEEHAALPHNEYGVAWDRVSVRKTCDTTRNTHYFNRGERCDCGAMTKAEIG